MSTWEWAMRYLCERHLHHHETDGDGVCHFSNYLRLFEEAMAGMLREAGVPIEALDTALAVTSVKADYLRPVRHGELFSVRIGVGALRRAYVDLSADIQVGEQGCCRLDVRVCAVTRDDGRSTGLPETLRAGLARYHNRSATHDTML